MAADILTKPIRELTPAIQSLTDVQELAALGRDEHAGAKRAGVLNLIQGRIGELVTAGAAFVDPAALPPLTENATNIFDVPGNRDLASTAVAGGNITQRREANVLMYFKNDAGLAMPRFIAAGTVPEAVQNGATDYCPDCGSKTCGLTPDGKVSGDPNACFARDRTPFARCPICTRPVYDPGVVERTEPLEDGEVDLGPIANSTPQTRLKAQVETHMLAFHRDEARLRGITPMPTPDQIVAVRGTGV